MGGAVFVVSDLQGQKAELVELGNGPALQVHSGGSSVQ